jgi:hypothetical protein
VTATPARHGPAGIETLVAEVTGFMVSSLDPPQDLAYVTGDTVWFSGTVDVACGLDAVGVLDRLRPVTPGGTLVIRPPRR